MSSVLGADAARVLEFLWRVGPYRPTGRHGHGGIPLWGVRVT